MQADSSIPTHVVSITPPGRGAVAVVLVSGPKAVCAVDKAFLAKNKKPLHEQTVNNILFGHWLSIEGEALVVCRRADDVVEVHPHGGTAAVQMVIQTLIERGCTEISWQEWLKLNEDDSIQSAARIALAHAQTERTARILLDQANGALRKAFDTLQAKSTDATKRQEIRDQLLSRADLGVHLTRPWKVLLAGAPNVGKSSLINSILGFDRSIIASEAGTTRDLVSTFTAIDGWPVDLIDSAGQRKGASEIERSGIEFAQAESAKADLILWIEEASPDAQAKIDSSQQFNEQASSFLGIDHHSNKLLCVLNKIDKLESPPTAQNLSKPSKNQSSNIHLTSATTNHGIEELLTAISQRLVPNPPNAGEAVPFLQEHIDWLKEQN